MTEFDSLRTSLRKFVELHRFKFYIFGTMARRGSGADVDLLLVYPSDTRLNEVLRVRLEICSLLRREYNMDADVLVFSQLEADSNDFIDAEGCVLID